MPVCPQITWLQADLDNLSLHNLTQTEAVDIAHNHSGDKQWHKPEMTTTMTLLPKAWTCPLVNWILCSVQEIFWLQCPSWSHQCLRSFPSSSKFRKSQNFSTVLRVTAEYQTSWWFTTYLTASCHHVDPECTGRTRRMLQARTYLRLVRVLRIFLVEHVHWKANGKQYTALLLQCSLKAVLTSMHFVTLLSGWSSPTHLSLYAWPLTGI